MAEIRPLMTHILLTKSVNLYHRRRAKYHPILGWATRNIRGNAKTAQKYGRLVEFPEFPV